MNRPNCTGIDWLRISTAAAAAMAVCRMVYLLLLRFPLDQTPFALFVPLALYWSLLAVRGVRPPYGWVHALGGSLLVAAGSLVTHYVYIWHCYLEAIPSSSNCGTTLIYYSKISIQTETCLYPALAVTIVLFEWKRAEFPGRWRQAYVPVAGLGIGLFALNAFLKFWPQ